MTPFENIRGKAIAWCRDFERYKEECQVFAERLRVEFIVYLGARSTEVEFHKLDERLERLAGDGTTLPPACRWETTVSFISVSPCSSARIPIAWRSMPGWACKKSRANGVCAGTTWRAAISRTRCRRRFLTRSALRSWRSLHAFLQDPRAAGLHPHVQQRPSGTGAHGRRSGGAGRPQPGHGQRRRLTAGPRLMPAAPGALPQARPCASFIGKPCCSSGASVARALALPSPPMRKCAVGQLANCSIAAKHCAGSVSVPTARFS